jgi:hypothetical protein
MRDAAVDRGLAGGDLAGAGLEHLAHEDVVDLLGVTPARSSAALMAKPPRSVAANDASEPDSLPIGVRAPARMTEPAMRSSPGASGDEIAALPIPESYRAAHVLRSDRRCSRAWSPRTRTPARPPRGRGAHPRAGPRRGLRRGDGQLHQLQHGVDLDLRAAAHLRFLDRLGKESEWGARHDQDYHVVGSDASGVVLRVGSAVRNWKPGDRVTVHCNYVDDQDPLGHDDSMLAANQRIWGFETNFGGLADLSVVKANQLMPKPAHLTWEEAASTRCATPPATACSSRKNAAA